MKSMVVSKKLEFIGYPKIVIDKQKCKYMAITPDYLVVLEGKNTFNEKVGSKSTRFLDSEMKRYDKQVLITENLYDCKNILVLTNTFNTDEETFDGVVVAHTQTSSPTVGKRQTDFVTSQFKLFTGSVIIQN